MHRWDPIAPPVSGLVVPVHIDPTGISGPTRAQARGPRWRITSPGWAVPAHVSDTLVEQRILEAHARGGDEAVITGWAALRLQGGGFFDGLARDGRTRLAVPVAANGARLRSRDGIDVVGVSVDADADKALAHARQHSYRLPIAVAGPGAQKRFGLNGIPSVVLLDRKGRIRGTYAANDLNASGAVAAARLVAADG